jgi:hypothetical protein
MFAMLLHNQLPNLEHWIMRAAERNPEKAVDLMLRVSERFLPTLSKQEIVGKDGEAFTPITINIPTFNLPKRDDTLELREGTPTRSLSTPPSLGILSEGTSAMSSINPGPESGEGTPTEAGDGHYEYSNSAVSKEDGHYGHSDSAVSGEDSQDLPDSPEFVFLPNDLVKAPPPGYRKEF